MSVRVSLVGRGDATRREAERWATLLGWTLVELGSDTERVIVLGGSTPRARIAALRSDRPSLEVLDAAGLEGMDVGAEAVRALRAGDRAWLDEVRLLRKTLTLPRGTDLRGCTLDCPVPLEVAGIDLSGCRVLTLTLRGSGVILAEAALEGRLAGSLDGPDLTRATLTGRMQGLTVRGGTWTGARLAGDLDGCTFMGADLRNVSWSDARISRLSLERCAVQGVDFGARRAGLVLDHCDARGVRLALGAAGALVDSDLSGADLRGSVLAGLELDGCTFDGADLRGVVRPVLTAEPPAAVPPLPCEDTSLRVRAHGLDIVLRFWLGALVLKFVDGDAHREWEARGDEIGPTLAAVRTWGPEPSWSDLRVTGRANRPQGLAFWARALAVPLPDTEPVARIGDVASLLDAVRAHRADPGAWAVLLDALEVSEGVLADRVRRCLAGERPSLKALGLPHDDRLRAEFHRVGTTQVPFLDLLVLHKSPIPARTLRALAEDPSSALLDRLHVDRVSRGCGRLFALPVPRVRLGRWAVSEWDALFEGAPDSCPDVVRLVLPDGYYRHEGGAMGVACAARFPGLRDLHLGQSRAVGARPVPCALGGLDLELLNIDLHDGPITLDLTGCRAREVCVWLPDDPRAWERAERLLVALEGVERFAFGESEPPALRDAFLARGALPVPATRHPNWLD